MATIDGDISRLPESCVAHTLSLTSPPDSCRSATVSTTFRRAADSDTVWDRFLPPDHREILSRAVQPPTFSSKKELYFRLCDPILINGGDMSFELERSSGKKCFMISAREMVIVWEIRRDTGGGFLRLIPECESFELERSSGKKCFMILARELVIVWGDTPRYWRWIPSSDSRFSKVAELLYVCWLEIRGKIDSRVLSPKTTYCAYLVYKIAGESYGLSFPIESSVKVGTNVSERRVYLALDEHSNGWEKLEMGEFFIDKGDEGEVVVSLMEVNGGHWKKGLIVQGIEFRPKK